MSQSEYIEFEDLLKCREDEVEVVLSGQPLNLKFSWNPNRLTPKTHREQILAFEGNDEQEMVAYLATYLEWWNLRRNGEVIPVTQESLDEAPMPIIFAIMGKVNEVMRPNPKTSPTSSAGSDTPDS